MKRESNKRYCRTWLIAYATNCDRTGVVSPCLWDVIVRNMVLQGFYSGARIPRSIRCHIVHPSWSIDPNYVKLRKLVREGRRIADAWERQRGTVKIWGEKEKLCHEP